MDAAQRRVEHGDALAWLRANPAGPAASVITSLPDISELGVDFDAWRTWFVAAARAVIRWTPVVSIFYQSDIRWAARWVDKGYLIARAAEDEGASLWWHKIVCRSPPGTVSLGRPSYSHMICVSSAAAPATLRRPGPDVLPSAGAAPWTRGMGVTACRVACRFLRDETATQLVVDPFCGRGTVLAVANALGFDALGIELNAKRCRAARRLTLGELEPEAAG